MAMRTLCRTAPRGMAGRPKQASMVVLKTMIVSHTAVIYKSRERSQSIPQYAVSMFLLSYSTSLNLGPNIKAVEREEQFGQFLRPYGRNSPEHHSFTRSTAVNIRFTDFKYEKHL